MKKLLALLLALLLVFGLTACGETVQVTAEDVQKAAETVSAIAAALDEPDTAEAEQPEDVEFAEEILVPEETAAEAPEETPEEIPAQTPQEAAEETSAIDEDGVYTTKEDVALYIHTYGHLPQNFISKKEAQSLGWEGGSLEPYAPGKCIGGSHFGNYEGILPEKDGRTYTECDIDTLGADKRGAKRIVFSNDGLIYYTEDHYETFELLYGEDG